METLTKITNDERTAEINGGETVTPFDKMEREAAEAERKAIMQDMRDLQKRIWCFENSYGMNLTKCGNAREFLHHASEQIQQC